MVRATGFVQEFSIRFLQTCCEVDKIWAAVCAFLMTVTMRVAAYTYRLTLPAIPIQSGRTGGACGSG